MATIDDYIISENIDLIIYGTKSQQFIEQVMLKSSLIPTILERSSNKAENQSKFQQNQKDILKENNYFQDVNKLLDLDSKNQLQIINSKDLENDQDQIKYLTWCDFKKCSTVISTKNFWFTINFHLVSNMFLDPYINNFVSANINLLVLTYEIGNENEEKQILSLFNKLATSKPPSCIKYQSQMLLLQSGYYQAFSDNIVLALCELPAIEQLGPCFLAGFGTGTGNISIENNTIDFEKSNSRSLNMSNDHNSAIIAFYEWLISTHQKIKYQTPFSEDQLREIINAIDKEIKSYGKQKCLIV